MKQSWDRNVILWLKRIRAHKDCPKTNKVFGIPQIPLQKFKYILIDLFWYSKKHKHGRIRSFSIQSKKRKVSASAEHLINLVNMWSIMSNCTETTFKDVAMPRVPGSVQFGKDWVELNFLRWQGSLRQLASWSRSPARTRGPRGREYTGRHHQPPQTLKTALVLKDGAWLMLSPAQGDLGKHRASFCRVRPAHLWLLGKVGRL